jgi:hypothetical protein
MKSDRDLFEELAFTIKEVREEAEANRPQVIVDTAKVILDCVPKASDHDILNAIAECGLDNLTVAEVEHALMTGLGKFDGFDDRERELLATLIERAKRSSN